MDRTTLFTSTREALTLEEAVAVAAPHLGEAAVALFYTPRSCRFGLWDHGAFLGPAGAPMDLADAYEARAFGAGAELRWLRDPDVGGAKGRAAFISEAGAGPDGWAGSAAEGVFPSRNRYLLWGQGWEVPDRPLAAGWSRLATSRIDAFPVPIEGVARDDRVAISTVEYFGPAEGDAGEVHGNVVVVEERLVRLEKVKRSA